MADDVTQEQEKLDELNAALGIVSVKHGENQTVYVSDTSKIRAELKRAIRKAGGVIRQRVRYNLQPRKGF